jgi:hypothetical protein
MLRTCAANSQWLIRAAQKAGISVDAFHPESRAQLEAQLVALPPGRSALYLRWTGPEDAAFVASWRTGAGSRSWDRRRSWWSTAH